MKSCNGYHWLIDTSDCQTYYQCVNGQKVQAFNCSPGSLNMEIVQCVENQQCAGQSRLYIAYFNNFASYSVAHFTLLI